MTSRTTNENPEPGKHPKVIVDRYEVVTKLGEGGMGVVYKAWDPVLDQDVSIKLLKNIGNMEESAMRFQREAKAASHLTHAHLAPVLDFGATEDGVLYMVSKFIEGETLSSRINKKGYLSIEYSLAVIQQIADCMAYIHNKGILHRDLKASNIIVSDIDNHIEAYVLDFGIAKLLEEHILEDGVTSVGTVLGSPMYMSPEQGRGKDLDFRSDIYSLGCLAYDCVTGRPPFKADTIFDIINMHTEAPVPKLSSVSNRDDIPEDFENLIYSMLNKLPKDRPASMEEVVLRLEQVSSDLKRRQLFFGKAAQEEADMKSMAFQLSVDSSAKSKAGLVLLAIAIIIAAPLAFFYFQNANTKQRKNESKMIEAVGQNSLDINTTLPTKAMIAEDSNPKNQFLEYLSPHYKFRCIRHNEGWTGKFDYNMLKKHNYDFYLSGFDGPESTKNLKEVLSLNHLIGISGYQSNLDNQSLKLISEKKNIHLLELTKTKNFDQKGLSYLKNLPSLQILNLSDCNLNDSSLEEIADIRSLSLLDLDYNKDITNSGIAKLLKSKSPLKVLSLKSLPISDEAMKSVSQLKELEQLQLNHTAITDKALEYLANSSVKIIDLTGTKISDIGLSHLSKSKSIKTICVQQCPLITKFGLRSFLQKTGSQSVAAIY